jgi:hypothetical protein
MGFSAPSSTFSPTTASVPSTSFAPAAPVTPTTTAAPVLAADGTEFLPKGASISGLNLEENLGTSVSISGDGSRVLVGIPSSDESGFAQSGAAAIFEFVNDAWTQLGLSILGGSEFETIGNKVAISRNGEVVAVGSGLAGNPTEGITPGVTRVYSFANPLWEQIGADITGVEGSEEQSGTSIALNNDGSILAVGSPGFNVAA